MPAARRLLVAGLALAVMAALGYLLLWPRGPEDKLPLADVPNAELERAGIVVESAGEGDAPVSSAAARSLAHDIACCGDIQQTVLVRLARRDDPSAGALAWAVNFDTSSGPDTPPSGGYWRTGFTNDEAFFVLFLDAATGKHIYSLFPGTGYHFPENAADITLDGVSPEALRDAGIRLERPEPGDRATFAPTRERLYANAAVELGHVQEIVLARTFGEPNRDSALVWVAVVNVGAEPQSDVSGQVTIGPYRYTLVFIGPQDVNAIFQRDVFVDVPPTLDGVSPADLSRNGISLSASPPDYAPAITELDARAAVSAYNPNARIKQLLLARVVKDTVMPKLDRVLWIANLDVTGLRMALHGGPGTPSSTPYTFSLVLVDADTAIVLGEVSEGAPIGSPTPLGSPLPPG